MKEIPLFGQGVRSYSDFVSRQRRLNMMYDIRTDGDRKQFVAVSTHGCNLFITLPQAPIYGWHEVAGILYVVAGNGLYQVLPGGSYSLAATFPTNINQYVEMADNSAQLIIVTGSAGYVYQISPLPQGMVPITDTGFPDLATTAAFLNEKIYVNDPSTPRQFDVSANLDATSWSNPFVFGTKESKSDPLVALRVLNGILILFGQTSMEFWQDVGSAPLAVQIIPGSALTWGCAAKNSIAAIGGTMMFLATNPDGAVRIMEIRGYAVSPVSTSDIDTIVENFPTVSDAVAYSCSQYGHSIYQITFPSQNRTFCYDMTTKVWHEAQTGLDPQGRHIGNLGITFANQNLICDATTGNIYSLSSTAVTDAGTPIRREICTKHIRNQNNEFHLAQLVLDLEVAGALQSVDDPYIIIRISRDGGKTFGPEKRRPLGKIGQYLTTVKMDRLGWARDMVISISTTDPVPLYITGGSAVIELADG